MKKLLTALLSAFCLTASAQAATNYYVAPLLCKGEIMGAYKKNGIHPDYYQTKVKVASFRSTKKNGAVVDSNYVSISASSDFYRGSLEVDGRYVSAKAFDVYGGDLELVIVSSRKVKGKRIDQLEGTMGANNSWGYTLKCNAVVVSAPSKTRDDRR